MASDDGRDEEPDTLPGKFPLLLQQGAEGIAVGLACGGTIRVLLEPVGAVLSEPLLAELVAARAARQPMAYCVNCETGANALHAHGYEERMRLDRSGFEPDGNTFVSVHNPKLRLIIVGAVHIAQALVPMAELAGFDVRQIWQQRHL